MSTKDVKIIEYVNFDSAFPEMTEAGVLETCINVANEARSLAPVDKGALRSSIVYQTPKVGGGLSVDLKPGEGAVGSPLEYSIYQEFGTRYMAPQPYLRPAVAIWAYSKTAEETLANISEEKLKGKLKQGQERVKFY